MSQVSLNRVKLKKKYPNFEQVPIFKAQLSAKIWQMSWVKIWLLPEDRAPCDALGMATDHDHDHDHMTLPHDHDHGYDHDPDHDHDHDHDHDQDHNHEHDHDHNHDQGDGNGDGDDVD